MSQKISFSQSMTLGFNLFGKTLGWQILFMILFFIILIIASLISGLVSFGMPFVSQVILGIVLAPLVFGFALLYNDKHTTGQVDFGVSFSGFKKTGPLFLIYLIQQILSGVVFLGLGYLLLSESTMTTFSEFMDQANDPTFFQNSELMSAYSEELINQLQNDVTGLGILGILSIVVSILFMFPSYYVVFKNESVGGALSRGVKLGLNNLPIIFITLLVVMIIGIVVMLIPILNILFAILMFVPFIMSFVYAMFRSAEPNDNDAPTEGMEEILDMD
ncbi:MAG: hypothetical protein HWD92_08515 [Flavobacteriia bacterium]|nr:hypothetical protein [Flavobacteriia bacterium]